MVSSPYVAGIIACAAKNARATNPHGVGTERHVKWNAGWLTRYAYGRAVPTPAEITAARLDAGLTQPEAAALVHWKSYRRWSERERGHLPMPPAKWELFKLKVVDKRDNNK